MLTRDGRVEVRQRIVAMRVCTQLRDDDVGAECAKRGGDDIRQHQRVRGVTCGGRERHVECVAESIASSRPRRCDRSPGTGTTRTREPTP